MKRQSRAIFVVLRVGKTHGKKFLLFSKVLGFLGKAIGLGAFLQPWLSLGTPELVLQTVPKAPGGTKEPELQCVPEGRRDALMV